jgi:pyruvate carboxylase subunit B
VQPGLLPPPAPVTPARPAVPAGADSGSDIVAPMPGTILAMDVQVGQAVEAGQQVCILEAMKMKNPIRATHAGVVAEVAVQAGQTVAYGARLVRLA